jgi:hypothetical protein
VSASSKLTEGELGIPHELKTNSRNRNFNSRDIVYPCYLASKHHWHMTLSDAAKTEMRFSHWGHGKYAMIKVNIHKTR